MTLANPGGLIPGLILAAGPPEPKDIKPDFGYFPVNQTLFNIAQGLEGSGLIIMVILFSLGALGVIVGKFSHTQTWSRIGWGTLIACLIVAALLGCAGGAINWAYHINIFATP